MLTKQIAKHFREIFFGGNWTCSNLKENLKDVSWKEATTKVQSFNTIATLTFHVHYFVAAALKVMQGGPLDANDKYSFDHPLISSQEDWQKMQGKIWDDAENLAVLIEQLPESKLWENFTDEKYGNYYRNLHGIIEHTHYHLGQIAIIKKIVQSSEK
jgi:hypothetical protein